MGNYLINILKEKGKIKGSSRTATGGSGRRGQLLKRNWEPVKEVEK